MCTSICMSSWYTLFQWSYLYILVFCHCLWTKTCICTLQLQFPSDGFPIFWYSDNGTHVKYNYGLACHVTITMIWQSMNYWSASFTVNRYSYLHNISFSGGCTQKPQSLCASNNRMWETKETDERQLDGNPSQYRVFHGRQGRLRQNEERWNGTARCRASTEIWTHITVMSRELRYRQLNGGKTCIIYISPKIVLPLCNR